MRLDTSENQRVNQLYVRVGNKGGTMEVVEVGEVGDSREIDEAGEEGGERGIG